MSKNAFHMYQKKAMAGIQSVVGWRWFIPDLYPNTCNLRLLTFNLSVLNLTLSTLSTGPGVQENNVGYGECGLNYTVTHISACPYWNM